MAWQHYPVYEPWAVLHPWPAQVQNVGNASTNNAQRNGRRRGGRGQDSASGSWTSSATNQHGSQGGGGQPPGIWKMPSAGQETPQSGGIRSEVLALRNARDADARQVAVDKLKKALLTAAHADEALDGMLLGMAAAQCSKHGLSELMGLICAFASCRLGNYGAREVAEMASAAAKLGCAESGFLRAVVAYCSAPADGLFASARDVGMVATALLQSLRQDTGRGARANRDPQIRTTVNHVAGLLGLAEAAIANVSEGTPARDLSELAHVFGHALDVQPNSGEVLHERPAVRKVIRVAVEQLRLGIHRASARDATMTAGAISSAWPYMDDERESVFRPCLMDISQLARFRRTEFNTQDLSLLALAFSKTGVATRDLIDMLNEQVMARISEFSHKDLVLLLDAGARTEDWVNSLFVQAAAEAVSRGRLSEYSPQDLCFVAQSLAIFGTFGKEPLQKIAAEAFRRQLCNFSSKDKALLLCALAKARSKEAAVIRISVRALAVEDSTTLDRETLSSTLWALARVWPQLPQADRWAQSLLCSLCATCPWVGATTSEVCQMAWALGQLPVPLETEVWGSFLTSIEKLPTDTCTVHELCCLLSGFSRSPSGTAARRDGLADRFLTEMSRKLHGDSTTGKVKDSRLLSKAIKRIGWTAPPTVAEFIKRSASGEEMDTSDYSSEEDDEDTDDEVDEKASEGAQSCRSSPMLTSSEFGGVYEVTSAWPAAVGDQPNFELPLPDFVEHGHQEEGHSCDECDGHGAHGHDGHGQAHVQGHNPEPAKETKSKTLQQFDKGKEESRGSQMQICSTAYTQASIPEAQAKHGLEGGQHCKDVCCPSIFETAEFGQVRLNAHCDFQGHCVQIKNTFLHISCGQANEPSHSEADCMVCRMTRSRSLDDLQRGRPEDGNGSLESLLKIPPGLAEPSSNRVTARAQRQHRGGGKGAASTSGDENTSSTARGSGDPSGSAGSQQDSKNRKGRQRKTEIRTLSSEAKDMVLQ